MVGTAPKGGKEGVRWVGGCVWGGDRADPKSASALRHACPKTFYISTYEKVPLASGESVMTDLVHLRALQQQHV